VSVWPHCSSACRAGRRAGHGVATADPPQRPDQPDVPDRVRELGSPSGLEVGEEVEPALVVAAVACSTERDYAQRIPASAQRAGDHVSRVDPAIAAAHDARASGDGGALSIGGGE
jgi:hypothetical protein